jgi:MFS transporter, PPP family, 3-phenylpropionic acid transporter
VRPGEAALAAGYFAYFAAVGVFQPYWPVRLAALGLPAAEIGLLLALVNAVRVVGPLGAAWLADQRADRRGPIRVLAVGAAVAGLALAAATTPLAMALALAAFSLAFNGLMPIYDAHALDRLGRDAHRYGLMRLWGSLGYVLAAAATGAALARAGQGVIATALGLTLGATALVALALPRVPAALPPPTLGLAAFARALRHRPLQRFLAIQFLQLAGYGGYYGFYTLYLRAYGYDAATIGLYWGCAVIAEIAMFALGPRLLTRYRPETLLAVALAGTALRWLVVAALPGSAAVMLAAQSLHLLGFGLFHSVSVLLGPRLLPPGGRARALALISSAGWGAGGIAGSLLAGALWQAVGPRAVFAAAAALALAGFGLALKPLKGPDAAADDPEGASGPQVRPPTCQ